MKSWYSYDNSFYLADPVKGLWNTLLSQLREEIHRKLYIANENVHWYRIQEIKLAYLVKLNNAYVLWPNIPIYGNTSTVLFMAVSNFKDLE